MSTTAIPAATTTPGASTGAPAPDVRRSPRVVEILGNRLELLVEGDDFPRASVVRYTVAPGFTAPPQLHHHVADDVLMLVLSGRLAVTGVDGERVAGAGEVVVLRHGTPFAWRNASPDDEAVYLGVYAPGGFEQYFVAVQSAAAEPGGLSPEVIGGLWQQYGIGVSGTPGA